MAFLKKPLKWTAVGQEPSELKKSEGFKMDESPAPGHFDFMFRSTYEAIEELQQKAGEVKTVNNVQPDSNGNVLIPLPDTSKLYQKPTSGIPKTDLESSVQTSLTKAESALQSVTKADIGLGNVDNTSDANKPISTAQQAALNLKANIASPTFTGTPKSTTAAAGTNTTQIATTAFVKTAVDKSATTINDSIATHQAEDATNTKKGHVQLVDDVNGNSTSLVPTQNAVRKKVEQTEYKVTKSGKDSNGIFTTVEYRRKTDNTLAVKSILSGGTSPKYITRTITYYGVDGTTVEVTVTKTLSYDSDGDLVSEV